MVKEIIMGIKRIKGKYILLKGTRKRKLERKILKQRISKETMRIELELN